MNEASSQEKARLQAVVKLGLLDKPEEERFQRITRLARRHFHAAACAITLLDKERAFYVARDGLAERQCPRSNAICSHVVKGKTPVVLADHSADSLDPIYQSLISHLNLHFYAGVPIITPEGFAVGALCVMDHIPRRFTRRELESLADFGAITEDEMLIKRTDQTNRELISQVEKLRIRAFVDPLTNVWNRAAIFDVLHRELDRSSRTDQPLSVCMLDLDYFKRINDTYGHQAGDEVLQELCRRVRSSIRPYDGLGRYGGEEFLIVFPETDLDQAEAQANRVRKAVKERPFELGGGKEETITVSLGVAAYRSSEDIKSLIARADSALYRAKNEGRDIVVPADEEGH